MNKIPQLSSQPLRHKGCCWQGGPRSALTSPRPLLQAADSHLRCKGLLLADCPRNTLTSPRSLLQGGVSDSLLAETPFDVTVWMLRIRDTAPPHCGTMVFF